MGSGHFLYEAEANFETTYNLGSQHAFSEAVQQFNITCLGLMFESQLIHKLRKSISEVTAQSIAEGSPCRNYDSSGGLCSLYSVRSQIEVFTLAHLPPTDSKELVNHTLKRG